MREGRGREEGGKGEGRGREEGGKREGKKGEKRDIGRRERDGERRSVEGKKGEEMMENGRKQHE